MVMKGQVLLTGGSGYLARGIMRQAEREGWACKFTVFSRDEYRQHLCRERFPKARYVLGDVRETEKLSLIAMGHDIIVHAGAMKYIVEAEDNIGECIDVNVGGTLSVVHAARVARVPRAVFISTDKAVEPTNTYGLTKALGEKIFLEASRRTPGTAFTACRYGNVIGSTGSIVPVFERQLALQGHITVTDPNATRFWISIDNAVDLVELALEQVSGSIVIPVADALSVGDIAEAMTNGVEAKPYVTVGLRPGEKLHEKLITEAESVRAVPDTVCYGSGYYIYHPDRKIVSPHTWGLTSDTALTMDVEKFMELAAEAGNI